VCLITRLYGNNNQYVKSLLFANRSTDYGRTFVNETDKFPSDAVAHWYYISKDNVKVVTTCMYML